MISLHQVAVQLQGHDSFSNLHVVNVWRGGVSLDYHNAQCAEQSSLQQSVWMFPDYYLKINMEGRLRSYREEPCHPLTGPQQNRGVYLFRPLSGSRTFLPSQPSFSEHTLECSFSVQYKMIRAFDSLLTCHHRIGMTKAESFCMSCPLPAGVSVGLA